MTGRPALAQPIRITDEDSCISSTSFNNIKYSMVGASCDDGSVAFWDVHTAKELQTFGEHKAPATGLAFSPVNEVLVASAGLDKRCVCYDTSLRKPVMGKTIDAPITSIDFAADGSNIVLGSSQVSFIFTVEVMAFGKSFMTPESDAQEAHSVIIYIGDILQSRYFFLGQSLHL